MRRLFVAALVASLALYTQSTHAQQAGAPHGGAPHGDVDAAEGGPKIQDTVEEDGALPPGTIEVEIRDPEDKPRAKVPVTLGIVQNSVAKGESRRHLVAVTSDKGTVRWDGLEGGSQMAYRVSVTENGGAFGARPFQLVPEKGMRVVLHTFPVVNDVQSALVVMQAVAYVELKDDRIQIQQAFNIFVFGKNAWVPRDLVMPLPEGFTALRAAEQMSDQTVSEVKDRGAKLSGTFTPGRHSVEFGWQLPYANDPKVDIDIAMPPNIAAARVMVVSSGEMKAAAEGFPPLRPNRDGQGNATLETEKEFRREDAPLRQMRISLTDIPTPGPLRWVVTGIAAACVAFGVSVFGRSKRAAVDPKASKRERKHERERLLAELEQLERAKRAGDVGPRTYENARRELIDAIARTLAEAATG